MSLLAEFDDWEIKNEGGKMVILPPSQPSSSSHNTEEKSEEKGNPGPDKSPRVSFEHAAGKSPAAPGPAQPGSAAQLGSDAPKKPKKEPIIKPPPIKAKPKAAAAAASVPIPAAGNSAGSGGAVANASEVASAAQPKQPGELKGPAAAQIPAAVSSTPAESSVPAAPAGATPGGLGASGGGKKWGVVRKSLLKNLGESGAATPPTPGGDLGAGVSAAVQGAADKLAMVAMKAKAESKPAPAKKPYQKSMMICTDPMCNRCPPEMHAHMRQMMSVALGGPSKFNQSMAMGKNSVMLQMGTGGSALANGMDEKRLRDAQVDQVLWKEEEEEEEEYAKPKKLRITIRFCGLRMVMEFKPWFLNSWHKLFTLPPVMNPHNYWVKTWSKFFLLTIFLAYIIDPLFFFVLSIDRFNYCVFTKWDFQIALTLIRSFFDVVYFINMLLQCRLAFNATYMHVRNGFTHSSGEPVKLGELVFDERSIVNNYMWHMFPWDLLAVVPLPQVIVWIILPGRENVNVRHFWHIAARLSILVQLVPRTIRIYPILSGNSSLLPFFETAWAGFILNLFTFFLGSHLVGSVWYLLAIQRATDCLHRICLYEAQPYGCQQSFLNCPDGYNPNTFFPPSQRNNMSLIHRKWLHRTNATFWCLWSSNSTQFFYPYGLFELAIPLTLQHTWVDQWLYSLNWGLQQISTLAGNQVPYYITGEVIFMLLITTMGLFLFAFLIGHMQNFLQSINRRTMDYQLRRRDVENWMIQRDIPRDIQKRVRQLERYVWTVNQGVNEEEVLSSLTEDIQRDVRRHLSLELIKKCHIFSVMDEQVQDAICERLRQRLFINGTVVIKEGMPVTRMFFVLRGTLESSTTNKGRTGFYESVLLGKGDFTGEELLVYFIEKYAGEKARSRLRRLLRTDNQIANNSVIPDMLPKSERMVVCVGPVDGFSLEAEDIDFVCTQFFKVMQSEKVQRALDLCSLNRRTRAATSIQVWHRSRIRKTYSLNLSQMQQAVRTNRIAAILRSQQSNDWSRDGGKPEPTTNGGERSQSTKDSNKKGYRNLSGMFGSKGGKGGSREDESGDFTGLSGGGRTLSPNVKEPMSESSEELEKGKKKQMVKVRLRNLTGGGGGASKSTLVGSSSDAGSAKDEGTSPSTAEDEVENVQKQTKQAKQAKRSSVQFLHPLRKKDKEDKDEDKKEEEKKSDFGMEW